MRIKIKAFTLVEILITTVIISLLATLSITGFFVMREAALEEEPVNSLRIIQAAQKKYFFRNNSFWPEDGSLNSNIAQINSNLGLTLEEGQWTYAIRGGAGNYDARAFRNGGSSFWARTLRVSADRMAPFGGGGIDEVCCYPDTAAGAFGNACQYRRPQLGGGSTCAAVLPMPH